VPELECRPRGEPAWSLRANDGGEIVFLRELSEHLGGTCRVLIHQDADPFTKMPTLSPRCRPFDERIDLQIPRSGARPTSY
jgi:hypothetical protein